MQLVYNVLFMGGITLAALMRVNFPLIKKEQFHK